MSHILTAKNLMCVRDDRVLFENLNFSLTSGELLQIEGHNGSGKTSLLRILCGLALPAEGEIHWNDQNIEQIRYEYHADLTYLGHAHGVKGELTPLENLRIAQTLSANPLETDLELALQKVGLRGFEDVFSRTLSAGQQRRVSLARLLISKTALWILDEPFTSLDKKGIQYVEELLDHHLNEGGMVILTSHHTVQNSRLQKIHLNG
jgi:heme exporter protein A